MLPTWTRLVEMITPVPNCLRIKSGVLAAEGRYFANRIGENTPASGQHPMSQVASVFFFSSGGKGADTTRTKSACHKDGKKKANSQGHVVVAVCSVTGRRVLFSCTANAVS